MRLKSEPSILEPEVLEIRAVNTKNGMPMSLKQPLPPPSGFATWLDHAVERFDTREPWLDSLFAGDSDDGAPEVNREKIRESARMELRALRLPGTKSRTKVPLEPALSHDHVPEQWHRQSSRELLSRGWRVPRSATVKPRERSACSIHTTGAIDPKADGA